VMWGGSKRKERVIIVGRYLTKVPMLQWIDWTQRSWEYFKYVYIREMTKRKRERRDREIEMVAIKAAQESGWVLVDASLCSVTAPHYEGKK